MCKKIIVAFFTIIIVFSVFGQRKTKSEVLRTEISGVLQDIQGNPVEGATISTEEGRIFTLSNKTGAFKLKVMVNNRVLIEKAGFESKYLSLADLGDVIVLEKTPFLSGSESKVILPFGFTPYKKNVINSSYTIRSSEFSSFDNTQNVLDAILGRVPGMVGNQSVHGLDNALVVVDGVPGRDITNMNLSEVEQVTVLKDANSAVLYGVQSQNGVILVTTKRGEANKWKISSSVETGVSAPKYLPRYLNSSDYMIYMNMGRKNDGLTPLYDSTTIANTQSGFDPYKYPDINYYSSEYLKEYRPFHRANFEFSGGNDQTQYYMSLGWTNTGSLLKQTDTKDVNNRINLRANVDFRISDFLTSYLDVVAIFDMSENLNYNYWSSSSVLRPNSFPMLIPVDRITTYIDENNTQQPLEALNAAKIFKGGYLLGGSSIYKQDNLYGEMSLGGYSRPNQRTTQINQGFRFDLGKLVKGMTFSTNISFDYYNTYTNATSNTYAVYEPQWLVKKSDGLDSLVVRKYNTDLQTGNQNIPATSVSFERRLGVNGVLSYARSIEKHNLNANLVAYMNSYETKDQLLDLYYPHLGLQVNYGFNNKYLIDFSAAYTSSVKFIKNKRAQLSPTLGLAWIASEEEFLKNNKFIDYLKLRGSLGIIKSDMNINDYYLYEDTYQGWTTFTWNDGGRSGTGTRYRSLANPLLNYENRNNLNLGFEASVLNHSLWIEANYFKNVYTGLVSTMTNLYPAFLGNFNPTVNYGEEMFDGIDLGINYSKQIGDFNLKAGANFVYKRSEVIKRDELYLDAYQNRVGKPLDAIFGLMSKGLYKESDFQDLTNYVLNNSLPVPAFGTVKPGDIQYVDQNLDGKVDTFDEIMIGNSSPDFYYGINLSSSYKGLSLFVLFTGQEGAERNLNGNYYWVYGNSMKYSEQVIGAWNVDMTEEQKASAKYPRVTSQSSSNNFKQSDYWMVDNNFLRLQRIQLTYDLPQQVLKFLGVKSLNIYVRGSNLLTFSKTKSIQELNVGTEPQYMNFSLGLKTNF